MTTEQRQKIFNYFAEFGLQLMDSDFNEIENILSTPSNPSPLTAEGVLKNDFNWAYDSDPGRYQLATELIIPAMHKFASYVQQTGYSREELKDVLAQSMTSVYCCTRMWEAWQVSTMTQDDFIPAGESDDFIDDLVCRIIDYSTNKNQ